MKQTKNTTGTLVITGGDTARTSRYISRAVKAAEDAESAANAAAGFLNQAEAARNDAEAAAESVNGSAAQVQSNRQDIDALKNIFDESIYDPVIPLKVYDASWEGTDNGVTVTKEKNVLSFSGTHTGTYHYVSLLGDRLYASTGNNSTSIPEEAFALPFKAGLFYRLTCVALSTTTSSGFNQLSLRKKDGTIVANLFVPPTAEGSVKTIEFKSDGTPLALVMLLSGATAGLSFKIILDEIQTPVQALANGEYINIAPYIKNWSDGYVSSGGGVGTQTSSKEKITGYLPISGTVLRLFVSINTEILNGRDVYPMIGYYSDSAFLSRWNNTATCTEVNGENTLIYFASSVPANATRARLSLRTFGDSNIQICCFDSRLSLGVSLIDKPRLAQNTEDHIKWLENQVLPGNVIKPHIGVRSINHRGWLHCPENTLVAYKQSKIHGFEAGECDVRFTSDNVPVLLHDASINRTARNADGTEIGSTVNIASITYEQALTYDFGIYKGAEYAGTKIPTLEQYCTLCRNIGLSPYIEIEAGATWAQCNIIADTVIASGIVDEVTFISSDNTALKNVQKRIPQARYGVLPWTYDSSYLELAVSMFNGRSEIFLDINAAQITAEVVAECAAANVPIEAWVTDSNTIRALNPYVSGFTSNGAVADDVLFKLENPGEKNQREINEEHAESINDLQNAINTLQPSATASDVGKALIVKTVDPETGKPSEYEYGEAGGSDATMIAPVEQGTTASQRYDVGDMLVFGGQLCKATSIILEGDTFVIGTNIAQTTVGGELEDYGSKIAFLLSEIKAADPQYQGVDLTQKMASEISGDPWAWIQARIRAGELDGIHANDFIPFTTTNNVNLKACVAGINTYKDYGDTAVANHIDFISRELWPTKHVMNKANYNNGVPAFTPEGGTEITAQEHPWLASDLYHYINSLAGYVPNGTTLNPTMVAVNYTADGIYARLPEALKAVIVEKRTYIPKRFSASGLQTDDNASGWANIGKLWVPSEIEVYGTAHWGTQGTYGTTGFVQYPLFACNMNRVKYLRSSRNAWWLLSARSGNTTYFCRVSSTGIADSNYASQNTVSAPVCFRVS